MSVTPMDEERGGPNTARQEGDRPSWRTRVVTRLGALVRRLTFGAWPSSRAAGDSKAERSENVTRRFTEASIVPSASGSDESLPDRPRPFTYPTRNHGETNPVELVGTERQDTLTIVHPHNPDASITSDVWVPVER